jgi:mono/diheme cytochrome c family protein
MLAVAGLLVTGGLLGAWYAGMLRTQSAPPRGKLEEGRQVYLAHCAACHGAELEGEPNWRRRRADGTLPAPPHDANGHTWHHADAQLFEITKFGTAALIGGDYKSNMGGYEGVLSDAEIRAVLDFIKSRWPPEIRARQAEITARAGKGS